MPAKSFFCLDRLGSAWELPVALCNGRKGFELLWEISRDNVLSLKLVPQP